MKILVFTAIVLTTFHVGASAQTARAAGLVLSGSVISVSPEFNIYGGRDDLPFAVYKVDLRLLLRNDGETPLILFRPESCRIRLEFLSAASFDDEAVAEVSMESWVNPTATSFDNRLGDSLLEFAKRLEEAADPTKAGLVVVDPGNIVEFAMSVKLNGGYSLEIRPGQNQKDVLRNSPKSEFPAFRVVLHESFKRVRPDTAFLKNLQVKWKRFGLLVVDGNGEFTLRSETILNKTN